MEPVVLRRGRGVGGLVHVSARYDVCVTAFLLDCLDDLAHGVSRVRESLRPGGVWVFAGPLHYYQGGHYDPRPAPTLAQLLALVSDLGFAVEGPGPQMVRAPYVPRPRAFLHEADWTVPVFAARRR